MNETLLSTRDALGKALHDNACADDECDGSDLGGYECDADALLASGAVVDVTTLADDLCKRLCDLDGNPRLFVPGEVRLLLIQALSERAQ